MLARAMRDLATAAKADTDARERAQKAAMKQASAKIETKGQGKRANSRDNKNSQGSLGGWLVMSKNAGNEVPKLRGLSLFSGVGGIELGLAPWVETVGYVENNEYARSVLQRNMDLGRLSNAPIFNDVKKVDGREWLGRIDLITAGFPCQDISVVGKRKGLAGERSGLVREVFRIAKDSRCPIVFLENVANVTRCGGGEVVDTLGSLGYLVRWAIIAASEVGAPHQRKRWFCAAIKKALVVNPADVWDDLSVQARPNTACILGAGSQVLHDFPPSRSDVLGWKTWSKKHPQTVPVVHCGFNGVPKRLGALQAFANACVPQQAALAWRILTGLGLNRNGD